MDTPATLRNAKYLDLAALGFSSIRSFGWFLLRKISSISITCPSEPSGSMESSDIALRILWHINHAVLYVTPRCRFIWFALIPFLPSHIKAMAVNHFCRGKWES